MMCSETGGVPPQLANFMNKHNSTSKCAQCGKGEGDESSGEILKPCDGACKMVKYCSRDCQIAHRPRHKKECMKRVTEMQEEEHLFEKITEEAIFKQPPLLDDCPVCMLPLPALTSGSRHKLCCGKVICSGCIHAVESRTKKGPALCPFCRSEAPFESQLMKVLTKRMKKGDALSYRWVGCFYENGKHGLPVDRAKAVELWRQAARG